MLLQSLFFTVFSLVLTSMFAISALSAVHALTASRMQMHMLATADSAVERARAAAAKNIQGIATQENVLPLLSAVPDTADGSGLIIAHTSIDSTITAAPLPNVNRSTACDVHDVEHECNLSIGNNLAEQRVWETIDLHTTAASSHNATLRRHVLLRLLRMKPFASVIAVRDDAVAGSQLLGDPAGVPAAPYDATVPSAGNASRFRDTRIHIYEPCRFVTSENPAIATDRHVWANWQGSQSTPARQNACDNGAGETTQYTNVTRPAPLRSESSWGH